MSKAAPYLGIAELTPAERTPAAFRKMGEEHGAAFVASVMKKLGAAPHHDPDLGRKVNANVQFVAERLRASGVDEDCVAEWAEGCADVFCAQAEHRAGWEFGAAILDLARVLNVGTPPTRDDLLSGVSPIGVLIGARPARADNRERKQP